MSGGLSYRSWHHASVRWSALVNQVGVGAHGHAVALTAGHLLLRLLLWRLLLGWVAWGGAVHRHVGRDGTPGPYST